MEALSKQILESRKAEGFSQEQLAELSNVNLRTIQRIENKENEPRGKTLQLICEALDLNIEEVISEKKTEKSLAAKVISVFFLLSLNLFLMLANGILTLGTPAKIEIRTGAILLSFLIPFFIVWKTQNITGAERFIKFGSGYVIYFIMVLFTPGFVGGFVSFLYHCLLISSLVLFYGKEIILVLETKS